MIHKWRSIYRERVREGGRSDKSASRTDTAMGNGAHSY